MKRDLTKGSIGISLFVFALPMIFGNLLQQLYNLADMWIVGRYIGHEALAAVGSSYSLVTFLTSVFIGLCMGSGALLSFLTGQRDEKKLRGCVLTAFVLIGAISLGVCLIVLLFSRPILILLRTPAEIFASMQSYVMILAPGLFFIFLYNFYAFSLRASGDSIVPLCFLGASSLLNIGFDLWFVGRLSLGLEGAAAATVLAQLFAGLGLAAYANIREPLLRLSVKDFLGCDKPVREILSFSLTSSAQQSVMNFGILMIQGLVNSFGVNVMSAFAAAVKIDTFAYMPAQEFGSAYSIFVSQNYGANERGRIKSGTKTAVITSAVFCAAVSAIIFAFAKNLMELFIDPSEAGIIAVGVEYLRTEGAFYALIGILFLLYGYFRGTNRPMISLILTVISLGARVVLAYSLSAVEFIGVTGIWWSIPIGWLLADAVGFLLMLRGREK